MKIFYKSIILLFVVSNLSIHILLGQNKHIARLEKIWQCRPSNPDMLCTEQEKKESLLVFSGVVSASLLGAFTVIGIGVRALQQEVDYVQASSEMRNIQTELKQIANEPSVIGD